MEQAETEDPDCRLYSSEERISAPLIDRELVCIEYPGLVQNVDKAWETLGGIKSLAKGVEDPKQKVRLRFRPDDMYSKPVNGRFQNVAGLLMRVRRRKKKLSGETAEPLSASGCHGDATAGASSGPTQDDGYEYKVEMLGTVSTALIFGGLCEFQYLPVRKREGGGYEDLLDKLTVGSFMQQEEFMAREAPLFVPPITFTRFDFVQKYGFMVERGVIPDDENSHTAETLAPGRKARASFTTMINFLDPAPQAPSEEMTKQVRNFKDTGLQEALEELFAERPIWSKGALRYRLRKNPYLRTLKSVLSAVGYVFLNGPWRTFWVRFGYDPRKDPSAKKFQAIDLRRRQKGIGHHLKIRAKRSMFTSLKGRYSCRSNDRNTGLLAGLEDPDNSESSTTTMDQMHNISAKTRGFTTIHTTAQMATSAVLANGIRHKKLPVLKDFEFHPDVLPPYRQVMYQVCDIFEPEVQAMASKNDGKETRCDERNGWGVQGFTDRCRAIMTKHVDKLCPEFAFSNQLLKKKATKTKKILQTSQISDDEDGSNSMDTSGFD